MCAIAGVATCVSTPSRPLPGRMCDVMRDRGPDAMSVPNSLEARVQLWRDRFGAVGELRGVCVHAT